MAALKPADLEYMRMKSLQQQREQERKLMQDKISRLQEEAQKGLQPIDSKFASIEITLEDQLKAETVGLKTLDEFRKKRLGLDEPQKKDEEKNKPKKPKTDKVVKHKLSFAFDEEGAQEESETNNNNTNDEPKKKVLKNPDVETSFLPDKERDELEMKQREELARQWREEQLRIKNEDIDIMYSYWDGSGVCKVQRVKKGISIAGFLERLKYEVRELRGVPLDNLMFVKQDLVIPQHLTFYDLMLSQARGKTGPLFHFDVYDDPKLLSDAAKDKDDSHSAKIVEKKWYEKNKLNYPASKWEVFDPFASTSKYTIQTKQF